MDKNFGVENCGRNVMICALCYNFMNCQQTTCRIVLLVIKLIKKEVRKKRGREREKGEGRNKT
jgi:hypothetical protein